MGMSFEQLEEAQFLRDVRKRLKATIDGLTDPRPKGRDLLTVPVTHKGPLTHREMETELVLERVPFRNFLKERLELVESRLRDLGIQLDEKVL